MGSRISLIFYLLLIANLSVLAGEKRDELLRWDHLPSLPDKEGFAGMFSGVSNSALIVAGGANFPNGPHWEGGEKVWYDKIYILEDLAEGWMEIKARLPNSLAYGVSVTHDNALICIGGEDGEKTYRNVIKIEWTGQQANITYLEPMPVGLSRMAGGLLDDVVYVVGGRQNNEVPLASNDLWAYHLGNPGPHNIWEKLAPLPGPSRIFPVVAVQDDSLFVMSGMEIDPDGVGRHNVHVPYLNDGYRYFPGAGKKHGRWQKIADLPRPVAAAASPAMTLGQSHFAIFGGLDGSLRSLDRRKVPPYSRNVLLYHTITNTWVPTSPIPLGKSRVTLPAVTWNGSYVLVSGESGPAKRSPGMFAVKMQKSDSSFTGLDWLVLGAYMATMLGMGCYFSKREKTTRDFFLAGGRIPWWAAGLSMVGTTLSAISFMAIPAVAFATDWVRILNSYSVIFVTPIVVYFILPFFKRLEVVTAYEYLEKRFNRTVRQIGSGIFIVNQLARVGIVMYLPAIALSAVTGMNVYLCILLMGVFSTIYTVLGGIEAVVWTDVVQVIVLLFGAVICLAMIIFDTGGIAAFMNIGFEYNKFRIFDWRWDPTAMVVWVIVTGSIFKTLGVYTSDQSVVQRYLTTSNEKNAAKGIWTNMFMLLPLGFLFYGLGTGLFVFYKLNPERLSPGRTDEIVPWFIVHELPAGVAALVIAGIFSAAMSSLDSSMNSTATAYVTDFYRCFYKNTDDKRCLFVAKYVTVFVGIVGTGAAMLLASIDVKYIMDQSLILLGLIGGGLTGIFILGIFTSRCSAVGAIGGAVAGSLLPLIISHTTNLNFFLYGAIGVSSCVVVGYTISWIVPDKKCNLKGLTIFTIN